MREENYETISARIAINIGRMCHKADELTAIKEAEDLSGDRGEPFAAFPESLLWPSRCFGPVSVFPAVGLNDSMHLQRRGGDSNPWYRCRYT